MKSVVAKAVQAVRLLPVAAYILYYDMVRRDPHRLAISARSAVRDSYFASRCRIPSMALVDWLEEQHLPVSAAFALPSQAMDSGGVGDVAFFSTLAMISAAVRPATMIEFGTFLGIGTATLVMNSEGRMTTIDLPDEVTGADVTSLGAVDMGLVKRSRHRVGSAYQGTALASRITEIRCDSRKLDLASYTSGADLILIDGGHSYDCVAADTKNALKVVSRGGVILWDDYFWLYPDVVRFLDECLLQLPLTRLNGTHLVALRVE
jgi:hypothetical protein